jgi:nicotinic acid mononucleotide adenylyltransferase
MKTYRKLIESLPSKTIVFIFGRFSPPHLGHVLLIKTAQKLAQRNNADCVIYVSRTQDAKKNPLSLDRKLHYLQLMFPGVHFVGSNEQIKSPFEAAKELNKKYSSVIMVAGSDRVAEFSTLLNKYNHKEYEFKSIKVVSAGDRDPDSDATSGMSASKMRQHAAKGEFDLFKQGLPFNIRSIVAKKLMNDVRQGLGLDIIKEQIKIPYNSLREKYFKGQIFQIGESVQSLNGEKFVIVKRSANHIVVKDSVGKIYSKWLNEIYQEETND